ncbi:MAG TPA: nicotinamidase, partial [Archangium sp.]|nr:nicotinamidase [Archangium sp.]
MPLPIPEFHDEQRVGALYLERAAQVTEAARRYAKTHGVKPAREDTVKIAAFGIDVQVAFCQPEASLFVPGAVEDTQ